MNVLWHDDGGMHLQFLAMVMKAMLEHDASGCFAERFAEELAECHEQYAILLLVVG